MSTSPPLHALWSHTTGRRGKCLPSHLPLGGGQEITRWGTESARPGYLLLPGEGPGQWGLRACAARPPLPQGLPDGVGALASSGPVPAAGEESASSGCLVPLTPLLSWLVFGEGEESTPPPNPPPLPNVAGPGYRSLQSLLVSEDTSGWVRAGPLRGFSPFLVLWPESKKLSFGFVGSLFSFCLLRGLQVADFYRTQPGISKTRERTPMFPQIAWSPASPLSPHPPPPATARVSLRWAFVFFPGVLAVLRREKRRGRSLRHLAWNLKSPPILFF